jgi:hypothetical protein
MAWNSLLSSRKIKRLGGTFYFFPMPKFTERVLAHYEEQTEEEALAEDEAAFENQTQTFMEIPNDLVPVVGELIAKHQT